MRINFADFLLPIQWQEMRMRTDFYVLFILQMQVYCLGLKTTLSHINYTQVLGERFLTCKLRNLIFRNYFVLHRFSPLPITLLSPNKSHYSSSYINNFTFPPNLHDTYNPITFISTLCNSPKLSLLPAVLSFTITNFFNEVMK